MFANRLPSLKNSSSQEKPDTSGLLDVFDSAWNKPFFSASGFPALDISESEELVTVKAEMPGMEPGDIDAYIEGDSLVLSGEKKRESEEKGENFHRVERSYGSFQRVVPLPCKVRADKVSAKYDKGVLKITVPKNERYKCRKIEII